LITSTFLTNSITGALLNELASGNVINPGKERLIRQYLDEQVTGVNKGPCYTETDIYYTETDIYYTETAKPIVVIRLCNVNEDPTSELYCSLRLVLHNLQLFPQH
jgi:hypothetical protein